MSMTDDGCVWKIACGREEGSIVMKLSAQSNKRRAWTLEFQAEPQTCEEANRRRGIGMAEDGGFAEIEKLWATERAGVEVFMDK